MNIKLNSLCKIKIILLFENLIYFTKATNLFILRESLLIWLMRFNWSLIFVCCVFTILLNSKKNLFASINIPNIPEKTQKEYRIEMDVSLSIEES